MAIQSSRSSAKVAHGTTEGASSPSLRDKPIDSEKAIGRFNFTSVTSSTDNLIAPLNQPLETSMEIGYLSANPFASDEEQFTLTPEQRRAARVRDSADEMIDALRRLLDADMTSEEGVAATAAARRLLAKIDG